MKRLILFVLLAGFLTPAVGQVQNRPGDTLRFVQSIKSTAEVEPSRPELGIEPVNMGAEIRVLLQFLGRGSAIVWFDSVKTTSPLPLMASMFDVLRILRIGLRAEEGGRLQPVDHKMKYLANPQFLLPAATVWL